MLKEGIDDLESRWSEMLRSILLLLLAIFLGQSFTLHTADAQASPPNLVTAIEEVAKQNVPAVVHVEVTERQEVANPLYPFRNDPFFKYFFNAPKKMPKKFQRELMGLGSGMVMDAEGHILTNNHVVAGASKIIVTMPGGEQFSEKEVKVVGTDPLTDLAVLKVTSEKPLPHVAFGNSDDMQVGQWVVAIGQPRGLSESVTQGIISAKHRRGISSPESYQDFLQTDAAINPGNSGGPLLNLKGEVIGVNAAIVSTSGGFEGIGFAIPSSMAVYVAKQLIENGKVIRGWMGIMIQDISAKEAQSLHLQSQAGALVADVVKGGPADKAGLKKGDVITELNGKKVEGAASLRDQVAKSAIGQTVNVAVLRDGKSLSLTVRIESQEEEAKILTSSLRDRLGVDIQAVTDKEKEKYGLESKEGVVITWVSPKGPLGKAGFEVSDLILEVNGEPIQDPGSFVAAIDAIPPHSKVVLLAVDHRTGLSGHVSVQIP